MVLALAWSGSSRKVGLLLCCAGLLFVTLGSSLETEALFRNVLLIMEPIILRSPSAAWQGSVIQALAMICFIAADKHEETIHVMNLLRTVFAKGECLCFLFCKSPEGKLRHRSWKKHKSGRWSLSSM